MTVERVAYLTWGETPRAHGVYRSQVAETVKSIAAQRPSAEVSILAGLPLVHSGLVREGRRYGAELRRLRAELGALRLHLCPIPVPQTFVFPRRRTFGAIFLGAGLSLAPKLRRLDLQVVHCRSLLAATLACDLRDRFGFDYAVLYDPRSLWPEMQYRRRPDPADLEAFRRRDRALAQRVDAIACVNDPMSDHFRQLGGHDVFTNYLAADLNRSARACPTSASGEGPRLIYAGALQENGIQDPQMLFQLFLAVTRILPKAMLTVATTSPHPPLAELAGRVAGAAAKDIRFVAVTNPGDMAALLAEHDLSCNVYRAPRTEVDRQLCETGFSTKSAEYLAAGLPILVSRYPAAVGRLIKDRQVGAIFDEAHEGFGLDRTGLEALMAPDTRTAAADLAAELFDRSAVANRFLDAYDRIWARRA